MVWRPCDTVESAVSWAQAIEKKDGPTSLLFSRQTLPFMSRDAAQIRNIAKGGYVLRDCDGTPEAILIATGSEVSLAVEAFDKLTAEGKKVRVVSMPSAERFEEQEESYKELVLPRSVVNRVAIEAGATAFWYKYVGLDGKVIGIDSFGASAPGKDVFKEYGFTVESVINQVRSCW